jgi:excisionase family DNA binding protein
MSACASHASEPLVTVSAAAREVGLSVPTLARLIKLKRVPHVVVGGLVKLRMSEVQRSIVSVEPVTSA